MIQEPKSPQPSNEEITRQLERMLDSPDFNATPQQSALLKYVVNQTLAGIADSIKGYTVATEVFGRRSDFDQSIDPIAIRNRPPGNGFRFYHRWACSPRPGRCQGGDPVV